MRSTPDGRGRRLPDGDRLSAADGRRIRVRGAGAHLSHDGAGPRRGGPDLGGPVPDRYVRERHGVQDPRHADRAQSQRLLRRVRDRGPRPRVRRQRCRVVRSSAAGFADPRLQ